LQPFFYLFKINLKKIIPKKNPFARLAYFFLKQQYRKKTHNTDLKTYAFEKLAIETISELNT